MEVVVEGVAKVLLDCGVMAVDDVYDGVYPAEKSTIRRGESMQSNTSRSSRRSTLKRSTRGLVNPHDHQREQESHIGLPNDTDGGGYSYMSRENKTRPPKLNLRRASSNHDNETATQSSYHQFDSCPGNMTYSRRIAQYLSKYSWYYPQRRRPTTTPSSKPNGIDSSRPTNATNHDPMSDNNHVEISRSSSESTAESDISWADTEVTSNSNGPDLHKAWAYYEYFTLGRMYSDREGFVRAEPGENRRPTVLYPLWDTPMAKLSDLGGVSIRLYFGTLAVMAGFLAVAGFLNGPLSFYFWRTYNRNGSAINKLWPAVRASAACTDTAWVPCQDFVFVEDVDEYHSLYSKEESQQHQALSCYENRDMLGDRYDITTNRVLKNNCNFDDWLVPGLFSYASSLLLILQFGVAFFWLQRQAEIVFDESMQSTSDYSVQINNPPPDAIDPTEWRDYFQPLFGTVTTCTVAINNAHLLHLLTQRRRILLRLGRLVTCDVNDREELEEVMTTLTTSNITCCGIGSSLCCCCSRGTEKSRFSAQATLNRSLVWKWWCYRVTGWYYISPASFQLCPTPVAVYDQLLIIEDEIRALARRPYKAVKVYLTFETERAQRNALHALSTGHIQVWSNHCNYSARFQQHRQSHVPSPNAILRVNSMLKTSSGNVQATNRSVGLSSKIRGEQQHSWKMNVLEVAESSRLPHLSFCGAGDCSSSWVDLVEPDHESHAVVISGHDTTDPLEWRKTIRRMQRKSDMMRGEALMKNSQVEDEELNEMLRFRGKHVLSIEEAREPNDVRWMDLQVLKWIQLLQYLGTTLAMIWFTTWSGFFIYGLEKSKPGTLYTPGFIAITNIVVPKICKVINAFESHSTEGGREASLFVKMCLFRWFNSAISLAIVINFAETIAIDTKKSSGNLEQAVFNLIFAELVTSPLLKLLDLAGFVKKHILAPRAEDQDKMNSYFSGGKVELAERYTDATRIIFVALFFSAILPLALVLGAMALVVTYAVDKFCLLRQWRCTGDLGTDLARLNRNYFFSTCLVAHVVMCSYWWSGYPFDYVCPVEVRREGGANNNYDSSIYYQFCNQDFLRNGVFPPLPIFQGKLAQNEASDSTTRWMTSSQEVMTSLYSWTALVVVLAAALMLIKDDIFPYIQSFYQGTYKPTGKDQGINFSEVKHLHEAKAYIPQLHVSGFSYPFLACDIDNIDSDLIDWMDPVNGFSQHSLVEDLREIMGGREPSNAVFSQVRHWPPAQPPKQHGTVAIGT